MLAAPGAANPAIRTVLLCDLVGSTQLVERLGDATAADLLARHDRAARDLLPGFSGREIDKSDGFLLLFERPVEAVRFALAYQGELRELGARSKSALASLTASGSFKYFESSCARMIAIERGSRV